ncbi:MAG: hypothetical protein RJA22_2871 [Verrucomicrobiota bacterium]
MRAADQPPLSLGESLRFNAANLIFLALGSVLTLAVLQGVARLGGSAERADAPVVASPVPATASRAPWGELELVPFALREPDEYLPSGWDRLPAARWLFEQHTAEQVAALFHSLPAPAELKALLLDRRFWMAQGDGVVVHPTRELLERIDRPTRQRLYPILGESRHNFTHYHPFRFRGESFRHWFEQSGLPGEILDLVEELTYTNRAGALCLADISLLEGRLTPVEFRQFLRSLYSEPTLLMSLRVRPGSDLPALAGYWGRGGREQQVLSLLKSVAAVPGGGTLSITHLLPPFARTRLYTFRGDTNNPVNEQDCFWTTVNFFRRDLDPRLAAGASPHQIFNADYEPCREPLQLGDALLFFEENNPSPTHACVYVADQVVFTKNGANYRQPWVLMPLAELIPRYSTQRPMKIITLRPRAPRL